MPNLGDKLKANADRKERAKLDMIARAARAEQEKTALHQGEVRIALERLRLLTIRDIEEGKVPSPIKLPRVLDNDVSSWQTPITSSNHRDHQQWLDEMVAWAAQEGLRLKVEHAHDGMGISSWWNLVVDAC